MQTELNKLTKHQKTKNTHTSGFVSFSLINAPGDPKVWRWLGRGGIEGIGELEGVGGLGGRWLEPGIPRSGAGWGLGSPGALFLFFVSLLIL